jgi:hypothetical protein
MRAPSPLPPWRLRTELPLALLIGAAVGLAAFWWFAPFHLSGAVTTDDLFDYCAGLVAVVQDRPEVWPLNRARLPAVLPAALVPELGTFDALLVGAVVGTGACGAGLYLWGSALGGRAAGVAAALAMLTMGPMVIQARMPSFYASINGTMMLAAGLTVAAVRTGRPLHQAVAGAAIGLALLSDARALVWALPFAGTAAGMALLTHRGRARWTRLLVLAAPLGLAWFAGAWSFPSDALSLEQQLDVRPLFHLHGSRDPSVMPPWEYSSRYIWGHTPLTGIAGTIGTLLEQARFPVPSDLRMHSPPGFQHNQVEPWLAVAGIAIPVGVVAAGRRRWRLGMAAVGTLVPYLVALWGLQHMVESQARFLTQGLPAVALGMGLCAGALGRLLPAPGRYGRPMRDLLATGLCLAMTFGAVPTRFSPAADWRQRFAPELSQLADLDMALRRPGAERRLDEGPRACATTLRTEHESGVARWSRWLDVRPP